MSPRRVFVDVNVLVSTWTTDALLMELAEANPATVMAAVRLLVATKRHPPRGMAEEVAGLRANLLARFADFVEERSGGDE